MGGKVCQVSVVSRGRYLTGIPNDQTKETLIQTALKFSLFLREKSLDNFLSHVRFLSRTLMFRVSILEWDTSNPLIGMKPIAFLSF